MMNIQDNTMISRCWVDLTNLKNKNSHNVHSSFLKHFCTYLTVAVLKVLLIDFYHRLLNHTFVCWKKTLLANKPKPDFYIFALFWPPSPEKPAAPLLSDWIGFEPFFLIYSFSESLLAASVTLKASSMAAPSHCSAIWEGLSRWMSEFKSGTDTATVCCG